MKILEVKKRLKKAGSKTIPEPGSVSRLAGSAHRWVQLYAARVQRKTTQSQTNCSGFGNNPAPRAAMAAFQFPCGTPVNLRN
ncbi:MAG: hypothetical protein KJ999_05360 [Gammaproteobacteria bacterium]|nr:hypothetical protein [Gammaproteobacteria bacterium]